ncbi:MAG: anthranilate synthase component I, partial [Hyphomicrobium sp.]
MERAGRRISAAVHNSAAATGGMDTAPDAGAFARCYARGEPQVVWTRLVADLETPVSAYLKLTGGKSGSGGNPSILLESVEGGATRGRYSVIALEPDLLWRARGDVAEINTTPLKKPGAFKRDATAALDSLRALLASSRLELPPGLPPMAAGVFGYLGYDTIRLVEHLPKVPPDDLGVPDSVLLRPTLVVIFDSVKDEMTVVTPVRPDPKVPADKAYKAALKRLGQAVAALDAPLPHGAPVSTLKLAVPEPVSNTPPADYLDMVRRAKEFIKAGD